MDEKQVKALIEFKERTEQERQDLAAQLLKAKDTVYEIVFDFATLHFRRISLGDLTALRQSFPKEEELTEKSGEAWNLVADTLEKYNADGIKKDVWLKMSKEVPSDVQEILLNLVALSSVGKGGMLEFFRQVGSRLDDRSPMRVFAPDTQRDNADTSA